MKVKEICSYLEQIYPLSLASSFDMGKLGLQFGSYENEVKKVMLTLDATQKVLEEALDSKVDLIITHHPFLFNPLLRLDYDSFNGSKLVYAISHQMNLFSMHTNFDAGKPGMNDMLLAKLGLVSNSNSVDEAKTDDFLRIGYTEPIILKDFIQIVKTRFQEEHVRYIGNPNKLIKKVGIIGGGGAMDWMIAKKANCDVFISGEFRHNNGIDIVESDFAIIEVSHSVERFYKEFLKKQLQEKFPTIEFVLAQSDTNPFQWN